MAALPDGTFLIVNGAKKGTAGFGLAENPNLTALLYDPAQPAHQRISILNTTIVARLYHSEATLLPDGRVLISGSDPQTFDAQGDPVYPEEFRIEVYVPPYLVDQGFQRPELRDLAVGSQFWAYGSRHVVTIRLVQATTAARVKFSLVAGNCIGVA
jgi:hypothetical protein